MPTKEYQCRVCGNRIERVEPITNVSPQPPTCHFCGVEMEWAPSGMAFELKGHGWPSKSFKKG